MCDYVEEYRRGLINFARNESSEIVTNDGLDFARVLIQTLFEFAKDEMSVLSSRLRDAIYTRNEVLEAGECFLRDRAGKIRILLQDVDPDRRGDIEYLHNHAFIQLCQRYEDQCELLVLDNTDKTIKPHFIIMDRNGFRFCGKPIAGTDKAIASFNHKAVAGNLHKQFEKLYKRAHILNRPQLFLNG